MKVRRLVALQVVTLALGTGFSLAGCDCGSSSSNPSDGGATSDASTSDTGSPTNDSGDMTTDAAMPDAGGCTTHLGSGFTQVVANTTDTRFGEEVSMALDENDDPMFAYVVRASNGTGKPSIYFVRWDPCTGAFTAPLLVAALTDLDDNPGERQVSIAYDTSTKDIGIAYQDIVPDPGLNNAPTIWLTTRKAGDASFSAPQMVSLYEHGDVYGSHTPVLGMKGGKLYIAYIQDNYDCCANCGSCASVWFLSRTSAVVDGGTDAGPAFFSVNQVKYPDPAYPTANYSDIAQPRAAGLSMAFDSNGVAGLAFYEAPATGYNTTLLYWNSTKPQAVKVTDSNNFQNDYIDVTLAYEGTSPRVGGHLQAAMGYELTFAASTDDGTTWGSAVHVPEAPKVQTALTSWLAMDGNGNAALAADINASSSPPPGCGNPYLAQSQDHGGTWSACGADTTNAHSYTIDAMNAAFGSSRIKGKLVLGFFNANVQGEQAGIVYWQKP